MDKIEIRAVIKYFVLKGLTPTDIKNELDSTLKETAPSFSTVKKWAAEFKRGRTSIEDDERTGRPKTATTDEIVAKINNAVLNDRRLKVREIAEAVKISIDRVHHILHEILDLFKRNPAEFLRRFITVDETWIHHYTPETKQQSKQWIGAGESVPKKAKTVPSAGKVMATVFWDSRGVVLIDYLQKGKTITGAYYSSLLDKLNEAIKAKRPHLAKKKVLFHHDNAPAHTSRIVTAKLEELRFEVVPHVPYSPDLAPSDFFLFPNLKKWLGGRRFTSNEEVIAETNGYFAELEESYYWVSKS
ncbi:hypothetical protein GEV33_006320 [Tenebrio molitor]|uniref:Mos1 transposase HTH domain-containing protein n=1 Tax=Tenebrio molitor TaxID=7067 RepID=A0A8J6LK46_TENMO|nr:hypothetical protein GEV33_006320 [Tenebrio molitor]